MLNLFKSDRLGKAYKAIEAQNMEQLCQQLKKITDSEINQPVSDQVPPLAEACILKQNSKALRWVLEHGASADIKAHSTPDSSLYQLALQQPQSHALLSQLLSYGKQYDTQSLLTQCFAHCDSQQVMLHISLFLQYGATVTDEIVHQALASANLPLINFLFNSGAELPEELENKGYSEEVISYARRCAEDLKIRRMFLS